MIDGPRDLVEEFSVDMKMFNRSGRGTDRGIAMREIAERIGGKWDEKMAVSGVQWMKAGTAHGPGSCEWTVFA